LPDPLTQQEVDRVVVRYGSKYEADLNARALSAPLISSGRVAPPPNQGLNVVKVVTDQIPLVDKVSAVVHQGLTQYDSRKKTNEAEQNAQVYSNMQHQFSDARQSREKSTSENRDRIIDIVAKKNSPGLIEKIKTVVTGKSQTDRQIDELALQNSADADKKIRKAYESNPTGDPFMDAGIIADDSHRSVTKGEFRSQQQKQDTATKGLVVGGTGVLLVASTDNPTVQTVGWGAALLGFASAVLPDRVNSFVSSVAQKFTSQNTPEQPNTQLPPLLPSSYPSYSSLEDSNTTALPNTLPVPVNDYVPNVLPTSVDDQEEENGCCCIVS